MMGTAVGNRNNIGVAPKSKFITCKSIDDLGRDNPESVIRCIQFLLAPHDLNAENHDYEKRPHVAMIPFCESCDNFVLRKPIETVCLATFNHVQHIFSLLFSHTCHLLACQRRNRCCFFFRPYSTRDHQMWQNLSIALKLRYCSHNVGTISRQHYPNYQCSWPCFSQLYNPE